MAPADRDRKVLKFLPVAHAIAAMSKDRGTKVGALALGDEFQVLGLGYNGFPRGVDDDVEARHGRPEKYLWTAHAEENLVATAARQGVSLIGATVIVTQIHPCSTCARLLIQAGVREVWSPSPGKRQDWADHARVATAMFQEAGVISRHYE